MTKIKDQNPSRGQNPPSSPHTAWEPRSESEYENVSDWMEHSQDQSQPYSSPPVIKSQEITIEEVTRLIDRCMYSDSQVQKEIKSKLEEYAKSAPTSDLINIETPDEEISWNELSEDIDELFSQYERHYERLSDYMEDIDTVKEGHLKILLRHRLPSLNISGQDNHNLNYRS